MSNRCTSRARQLSSAGSLRVSEPLAFETAQRIRRRRIPFDFQRTSLAGLALDSATSSGLGRAPALQCRTPSRQHLELQDRRNYTPADKRFKGEPVVKPVYCKHCNRKIFLSSTLEDHYMRKHFRLSPQSSPSENDEPVPQKGDRCNWSPDCHTLHLQRGSASRRSSP
ncbi:hypothetical protein TNCV_53401 [Trichonephila clavipes]|nr:hypothetical protein TNCV_53401 [Trichonephila clavipes]